MTGASFSARTACQFADAGWLALGLVLAATWPRYAAAEPHLVAPVVQAVFDTPGYAWHVALRDSLAVVSAGPAGLVLVDATMATKPVQAGALPVAFPRQARSAAVLASQVYVALWGNEGWGWSTEVGCYDISDPSDIVTTAVLRTNGLAWSVAELNDRLYVGILRICPTYIGALPGSVVEVFDTSEPTTPDHIRTLEGFSFAREVKAEGSRLLVADLQGGAAVMERDALPASSPAPLIPLSGWQAGDKPVYSLASCSNAVLAACGENGLWLLDVSDPDLPEYAGSLWLPGAARSVAVFSNLAAVALGPDGVAVLDVTEPLQPALAGWLAVTGNAEHVALAGDLLFVAAGEGGLVIAQLEDDDTDGDGLSDAWEQEHFESLDEDAAGNHDGDAFTNGEEQRLGTDPEDPASAFGLGGTELAGELFPVVHWLSVGGRRYDVEYSTNLLAPGGGFVLLGEVEETVPYGARTNRSIMHEVPLPADGSRYYRLKLAP